MLILALLSLLAPSYERTQAVRLEPDATAAVREVIAASGAEVAVAFRTLDGRDELMIDADKSFHAALNNTTTARGLLVLMESLEQEHEIHDGEHVSSARLIANRHGQREIG